MQRKSIFFCSWKAAKIDFPQIDHDWYTLYKHRRLKWSLILTQAKPIDNPHDASGQLFSSDPSPIIGYACHSMTDSLTNSPLFSKLDRCDVWLVEVVIVADVDDEKRFDNSLMQFWKLKFGHEAKFCSNFEHKVWPRVWSWSSSETFETEVWSVFCCWGLVRLWSKCLVKILMLKFVRKILNFGTWSRLV